MRASAFRWIYPYTEDPGAVRRHDREVLRPMVKISLEEMKNSILGLVDSGSERTIVAPSVGRRIGLFPDPRATTLLGMGGEKLPTAFYRATIRLFPPDGTQGSPVEWETEIGVPTRWLAPVWNAILGGVGFFDRFTITMQRDVQALAVEPFETFEERFRR